MRFSRKLIAVLCSVMLSLTGFQLIVNAEDAVTSSLLGDVNGDLVVQIDDATELQKLLVTSDPMFDLSICDINYDEKVNIKDATCIQKMLAGLPYETQPTEPLVTEPITEISTTVPTEEPTESSTATEPTEQPTTTPITEPTTVEPTTVEPTTVMPTEPPTTIPVVTSKTSTAPMYYTDFTTSPAYKTYSDFKNLYVAKYTGVMPGMEKTVVGTAECGTMTPQGICFAKDYMLISAYDSSGECNSVIYVISNTTYTDRQFVTSIVLPINGHVGGIAFDGSYVWVSNGEAVSSISYTRLNEAVEWAASYGVQSVELDFDTTVSVLTTASFMTYYDGLLWVGQFNLTEDDNMYSYEISEDRKTLTKKNRMTVPNRTQGIAFKNGYLVVSRSYSRYTTSKNYISQLRVYQPSWDSPTEAGFIYKNTAIKSITLPPMSEGIIIGSTYVYNIFESCSTTYKECLYPVDRIVAYKFSEVIKV